MWSNISLAVVQQLERIDIPGVHSLLKKLYNNAGYSQCLATLLNAIFSEKRFTFIIGHKTFNKLLVHDSHSPIKHFAKVQFIDFIKNGEETGYWKILQILDDLDYTIVGSLTHPVLTSHLEKIYGSLAMVRQRQWVNLLIKGNMATELWPAKKNLSQQELLTEARKKAVSMGLLSTNTPPPSPKMSTSPPSEEKMMDSLKLIEDRWNQERTRYFTLLDQLKEEEGLRLKKDDDPHLTRVAIETAIMAQKQKKVMEDLELQLLRLQDAHP